MSRESIQQAALELFRRYSYAKTSVADIATEAGIGKGTIYLSFKTKEDILFSILDDRIAEVRARIDPLFQNPAVSLDEKLAVFSRVIVEQHFEIRDLMFGSIDHVQGRELQDVYLKFAAYVDRVAEHWLGVLALHGWTVDEERREGVRQFVLFLSGRIVIAILTRAWTARDEIVDELPRLAVPLHRAFVLEPSAT